jgi:ABC-2 type transport system ATP-binding protein
LEYAVETQKLTRTFGDVVAVDGLDLNVATGTFFGFLGPNGAGKSTTIKMLTGMLGKSSGRASLLGHDIDSDPVEAKRLVGVVPEELALFDRLTAPEYLRFVGRMYGVSRGDIRSRQAELLELMELSAHANKQIVDYSHGMKKKLALAAALIHKPRLLFLDEPFEGIDAVASRQIKDLMATLVASGVTIFLTSHILEIVEQLCSDIAIIHRGKLVARGTLSQLRAGVTLQDGDEAGTTATLEQIFLSLVDADEGPRPTLSWLG